MANINARYITYPIVADARDLMQRSFDYLRTKMSGWEPSEGQLDTWVLEATGSEAADIASLTTEVPKSVFRYFGAVLFGLTPIDAVSATCTSTWFLTDSLGHTIPAGTQVGIMDSLGILQPFTVLLDVIVAGGASNTGIAQVVLIASNPGSDASGIGTASGVVQLIDPLAWVDHITQETVTTGGIDAETDDEYLNRLAIDLQTMSPRPILPNDFAILACNVAGVQRAAAVDGYNPASGGSFGNQRMVAITAVDSAGVPVGSAVKTAIQTYLGAMREVNFVVNVFDAAVQQVDVTVNFTVESGYDIADVQNRVIATINNFLDPRYWGIATNDDPNNPRTWNNIQHIYYLELGTAINNVAGVGFITLLTIGIHGGALASADLSLTGVVPLPKPNTIVAVGS